MRRKLIKQGVDSCTVSLPIKWVRKQGLGSGMEVEILDKDGDLLLRNPNSSGQKAGSITFSNASPFRVKCTISSAYKAGFDEITLRFNKMPDLADIDKVVNGFTGLEMVSQTQNSVTIKSFLQSSADDIEQLIVKMFQVNRTVLEELEKEEPDLDSVKFLTQKNLRRIRDHCLRAIQIHNYKGAKSYEYYELVTQLEKIGVQLYQWAKHDPHSKLFKDIREHFGILYDCYLKKDFDRVGEYWTHHKQTIEPKVHRDTMGSLTDDPVSLAYFYGLVMHLRHLTSRVVGISV